MADLTASNPTQLRKLRLDNGVIELTINGGVTWTPVGNTLAYVSPVIDAINNPGDPYLVVPQMAGLSFVPTGYYWRILTNSGLSVAVIFNIGSNPAAYTNVLVGETIGGASAAGSIFQKGPTTGSGMPVASVNAGGIFVHVTTPAAGTALTFQIILTGYFV